PLMESTDNSRASAINILYSLGKSVLLHRASKMIQYGFLEVHDKENSLYVKVSDEAKDHFLDNIEFFQLEELENKLTDESVSFVNGWHLFDRVDYPNIEKALGNFISRPLKDPFKDLKTEDVNKLMAPLIHPWDTGHGIMMGYGALPEIDDHFMAEAAELVAEWRSEAGLHPDAKFDGISGADITSIITYITFLHLKHIRFSLVALETQPQISIPQSLTIWEPLEKLEDSIVDFLEMDRTVAKKALHAITISPNEASYLHGVTKNFLPLLISLGNGLVLRPVASLIKNPFASTIALQIWRNPKSINQLSLHREEWMRSEIYSIFQGTRYQRVHGNVKLRSNNKIVTDIDAAIFDVVTGELALFQIKWQDYFTNDIRELRSKASNLTNELDEWAEQVASWIQRHGHKELIKTLRLRLGESMVISSVYLFGVSKSYARMQGFGYTTKNQNLAIANLPQFHRIRYEVGPANQVFHNMFLAFRQEMTMSARLSKPLPVTITVSKKTVCFEDFWNAYGDEEDEASE
ncbi:MAG TPA: hypothetical protein VFQ23_07190, partial [Anaerolineales bacterium]|nr:hypothetical protein [Anaerolineales bacterium]